MALRSSTVRSPKEHSTVAEAVRHPLRVRILEVLNQYDMSATEFVDQGYADAYFGHRPGVSQISYHFRELAQFGCLEAVALRPARGSVATIYRGVARAEFIGEDWVVLAEDEKRRLSRAVARGLIARIDGAMTASTFDARDDRQLAWFAMRLDERGWQEVGAVLADAFASIGLIQGQAEARLQASAEEGMTATASILLFESPELSAPPVAGAAGG
jgi:hypothetical protein